MVRRKLFGAVIAAVILLVVTSVVGCSGTDDGPRQALDRYLEAFDARDVGKASALTDNPALARAGIEQVWQGLAAEKVSTSSGHARTTADNADIDVTYTWKLAGGQTWQYPATVKVAKSTQGWTVRWASTNLHPDLGRNQRLLLETTSAPRATVNESDGSEVMVDGTLIGVNFDAKAAAQSGNVVDSVTSLVAALRPYAPGLSVQTITEKSTAADGAYPIARITEEQFNRIRDQLAIPGVVTNEQSELVAKDRSFAPALLSEVRKLVSAEVEGKPGWRVVTTNANGMQTGVLADHAPQPAPAVSLTLSRSKQNSAQRAVNASGRFPIAMVVLQASTGRILAIAQNPLADRQGSIATTGLFPPGSTFKIITATTAIRMNMAHPDTLVPCPGEIEIVPRTVPNYNRFALGTVSMLQAFAASCNTSFAKLASQMGPSDLPETAASLGIGPDYKIAGLDSVSGSVPIASDLVERTEDGFGQGKVLVSPLGLALATATVARGGKAPVPQLIRGKPTVVTGGGKAAIAPEVITQLRSMMRAVVTGGTADLINGMGEVYGKTGEAEFAGGSHAWFAGYRGDIAFATLVVGGGDSNNAVAVTRDFFAGLPR